MKKIVSLTLTAAFAGSIMLTFAGCGDSNYPVQVANVIIEEEPKNIVVLDPYAADIISFMGYDVKMIGRSDEVNQEWLSIVPSIGTAANPDVDAITEGNADVVFAAEELSDEAKQSLTDKGVTVITMAKADTQTQLETNYASIGKILGGSEIGAAEAEKSFNNLIDKMEAVKAKVDTAKNSDVLSTVCYLYMDGSQLKMMTNGTYGDMLLGYTDSVNIAMNISENDVDVTTLKRANPNYMFFDSQETYDLVAADATLGTLDAIKGKKVLIVTEDEFSRQGQTALNTLDKMVSFMYPQLAAATEDTQATAPSESATAAEQSVAADYKIDLKDLEFEYDDEDDNIKIMQQRLYDLGYVDDKENITGYFGEVSENAVKEFQKNNGIKETGKADNATLVKMFMSDAVKAK
jgi:iron complex transport system substrate-binding protein